MSEAGTSQGTAVKKATSFDEACVRSLGGGVWLGLLEICAAIVDVAQKEDAAQLLAVVCEMVAKVRTATLIRNIAFATCFSRAGEVDGT